MTASQGTSTELVAERLYVVGGQIPMDGRASWAPESATGWQPSNAFVLRRPEIDIIVDTGTAFARDALMDGLLRVLEPGAAVSVFLTRAQLDCVGSLAKVVDAFDVREIFTGGVPNPFDQFDAAPASSMGVTRSPADPPLQIFNPALRILPTYWGYDPAARTVFTADSFSHVLVADPDARPVLDDPSADTVTPKQVADHLRAGFWWLEFADAREHIADQLRDFFATHEVEIIAPSRGCVIVGEELVARHVDLLANAITGELAHA